MAYFREIADILLKEQEIIELIDQNETVDNLEKHQELLIFVSKLNPFGLANIRRDSWWEGLNNNGVDFGRDRRIKIKYPDLDIGSLKLVGWGAVNSLKTITRSLKKN